MSSSILVIGEPSPWPSLLTRLTPTSVGIMKRASRCPLVAEAQSSTVKASALCLKNSPSFCPHPHQQLLLKLMKRWGFVPERIPADKLRSYSAAKHEVASGINQSSHKGPNNHAVNSHLPLRKRERAMQGFRSPSELPRFVFMQSATRNCFSVPSWHRSTSTVRYHSPGSIQGVGFRGKGRLMNDRHARLETRRAARTFPVASGRSLSHRCKDQGISQHGFTQADRFGQDRSW